MTRTTLSCALIQSRMVIFTVVVWLRKLRGAGYALLLCCFTFQFHSVHHFHLFFHAILADTRSSVPIFLLYIVGQQLGPPHRRKRSPHPPRSRRVERDALGIFEVSALCVCVRHLLPLCRLERDCVELNAIIILIAAVRKVLDVYVLMPACD